MARGLNKAELIGRLGVDPETRYTQGGDAVVNFSVATSEEWKDHNGEKQSRTEWHKIVAWRKLAEIMGEYLSKGDLVYIEGKLQTRDWEDRDGVKRYTTEIVANNMIMLQTRGNNAGQGGGGGRHTEPDPQNYPTDPDDDIPF